MLNQYLLNTGQQDPRNIKNHQRSLPRQDTPDKPSHRSDEKITQNKRSHHMNCGYSQRITAHMPRIHALTSFIQTCRHFKSINYHPTKTYQTPPPSPVNYPRH